MEQDLCDIGGLHRAQSEADRATRQVSPRPERLLAGCCPIPAPAAQAPGRAGLRRVGQHQPAPQRPCEAIPGHDFAPAPSPLPRLRTRAQSGRIRLDPSQTRRLEHGSD